jgi:hypothetical protein
LPSGVAGLLQLSTGVLIILAPKAGFTLHIAVSAALALAHVARQRIPLASSMDVVLAALSAVAAHLLGEPLWLLGAGAAAGAAAFVVVHLAYPLRLGAKPSH